MSRRIALACAALAASAACSVDPLDLSGKRCPCADGFVCDDATESCVAAGSLVADGGAADDAQADAPARDAGGRITVFELRAVWQTGNAIRWDWKVLGDAAHFDRYELVIGPRAEDVRARASSTTRFDPKTSPELGSFGGRVVPAPAARPFSTFTVTGDLKEGQTVFAQVVAYDDAGGTTESDVASATTTRPRATLLLYDEGLPEGGALTPAATKTSASNPFAGAQCLEQKVGCGGAASCDRSAGILGITGKTANGIDVTDFDRAYLELAVRGARLPDAYSDVTLVLGGDACGAPCRMRFGGVSFAASPDGWQRVQIPLRFLKRNDGAGAGLNYAELGNRNFRVNGFLLSGTWSAGTAVGLDQVRLRW